MTDPRIALLATLLLGACAIAPPPAEPDPIDAAAVREEGEIALADAAQAAFCVSQDVPDSQVVMLQDGASVRPAAGPAYALTLAPAEESRLAWRLLVTAGASEPDATAARLRQALAVCLGRLGRST